MLNFAFIVNLHIYGRLELDHHRTYSMIPLFGVILRNFRIVLPLQISLSARTQSTDSCF